MGYGGVVYGVRPMEWWELGYVPGYLWGLMG